MASTSGSEGPWLRLLSTCRLNWSDEMEPILLKSLHTTVAEGNCANDGFKKNTQGKVLIILCPQFTTTTFEICHKKLKAYNVMNKNHVN